MLAFVCVSALIVLLTLLFTPRRSSVQHNILTVRTFLLAFRFDLRDAVEVVPLAPVEVSPFQTTRLFGIGWPLRRTGWFRNHHLGTFLNLADDPSRMYLVRLPRRTLVVSPAEGLQTLAIE